MKYRFIHDHQDLMGVKRLCAMLQVSRSGYYSWHQAGPSLRAQSDQVLVERILTIHQQSHGTYGSPRIWQSLRQQGIQCSRKRVARLMRVHGIRAKMVRRFKITTRSRSTQAVAPDLVQQHFITHQPNRVWTSDITYIWTRE